MLFGKILLFCFLSGVIPYSSTQAAEVCAKPNAFTDKNDFLLPQSAQKYSLTGQPPAQTQTLPQLAPQTLLTAPQANKNPLPESPSIERDFFRGGFVHTALGDKDNQGCTADETKSAFLVGAHQGLSGNRFTAFYQASEDSAKELEAFKSFACTEYGTPRNSNKIDFDYLLQDSRSAQLIKSYFELVENDSDKKLTAKEIGKLRLSVPYSEPVNSLKIRLAQELERLKTQNGSGPSINVKKLLETQFESLTADEKKFKCCMSGFQASFVYFLSRLKYSQAEPCSNVSHCKDDFNIGRQAASRACETGDCQGCRLEDLLAKNKDLWLGCASAGFMDGIWYSDACIRKQANKQSAAKPQQQASTPMNAVAEKKDTLFVPQSPSKGGSSAGSAKELP